MRISDWSSDVCSSDLFKADSCNNFRDLDQSEFAETLAKIGVIPRFAFPNRHDAPAQPFQLGFNQCIARDIGVELLAPIVLPRFRHRSLRAIRSEEHTYELQSLMSISYAVFCLKKKKRTTLSSI